MPTRPTPLQRFLLLLALCAATLATSCDDDEGGGNTTPSDDAADAADSAQFDFNRPDTPDTDNPNQCEGKALCTQEGSRSCSSSPQGVLECRRDTDGCLVQTLVEACTNSAVCAGDPPGCGGACDNIPTERACAAEGTLRCDGDSLQVCTRDDNGCFRFDAGTDCTAQAGANACVSANGTAACGFDPCANEDDCAEGRACTSASIINVCERDAQGCLRENPYDCALVVFGSTCDASGGAPTCVAPSGDPCEGVPAESRCDAEGLACVGGDTLEACAPNPFGCLVRAVTDCGTIPGLPAGATGYCDASDPQSPRCAADSGDRCAGLTLCDPALPAGSTCDDTGAQVITCAYDALGCFVETGRTDCAATNPLHVCNEPSAGNAACGASCVDECALGSATCANNRVRACATNGDADPCAEWVDGEDCTASQTICGDTGASSVACLVGGAGDTCAAPIRLEGSGAVTFNSSDFQNDYSGYRGTCRTFANSVGSTAPDVVFSIDLAPGAILNAEVTNEPFDSILALATDCATLTADSCVTLGDDPDRVTYTNTTDATQTVFLVADGYSSGAGTFTLQFTSRVPACGDGVREGAESCDDGNTNAGDGCATDCATVEEGYACLSPGQPCVELGAGDTCAQPIELTANGTFLYNTSVGFNADYGPYGGACGDRTGNGPDMVFSVFVDAGQVLDASILNETFDAVLALSSDCADISAACLDYGDSPETVSYVNETGAGQTLFLIADGWGATAAGAFNLQVQVRTPGCGDGVRENDEVCDDGNTDGGDGCAADCLTIEAGYVCGAPGQPCFIPSQGDSCVNPILVAADGLYNNNTATGGFTNLYSSYQGTCRTFSNTIGGGANDVVYQVDLAPGEILTAEVINDPFDSILALSEDCAALTTTGCVTLGDDPDRVTYSNTSGAQKSVFLVVDGYSSGSGAYDLSISRRIPGCGDGIREGAEACDDGNDDGGDGCAADCLTIEAGYVCGTPGEACFIPAQGDACVNPIAIDADGTYSNNTATGAFSNVYGGYRGTCRTFTNTIGGSARDVVYSVVVEPGEILTAEVFNEGFDAVLAIATDCATLAGDGCVALGDTPERVVYTNATADAQTVFLVVDGYSSGSGAFDLTISRRIPGCGDSVREGAEACDDGNSDGGDGCAADCAAIEDGYFCPAAGGACLPLVGDAEAEPNDDCASANLLNAPGAAVASINPAGERDFYTFTLDQAATVVLETAGAAGVGSTCPGDTVVDLYADATCATALATDDDSGDANCSRLSRDLAPGTYFVRVRGWSASAVITDYSINLSTTPIACGDGIRQSVEACDDGNNTDGDGCAADCSAIEPGYNCPTAGAPCVAIACGNGVIEAPAEVCDDANTNDGDGCAADCAAIEDGYFCPSPGAPCVQVVPETEPNNTCAAPNTGGPSTLPAFFQGLISVGGDVDIYTIDLPAGANLRAEVSGLAGTDCPGDLYLNLYNAPACGTSVTFDDDGGPGLCPLIDGVTNASARDLPAGTYYLRLRHYSETTGTITNPYLLRVTLNP